MSPTFIFPHDVALPLYTGAQLRAIEEAARQALPPFTLMSRAGRAAAQFIIERLTHIASDKRSIWFAVGPGDNGGDALVAATACHTRGLSVKVCMPIEAKSDDARRALDQAHAVGVPMVTSPSLDDELMHYSWAVDGLFGIGLTRALGGVFAILAKCLAERTVRGGAVLALDVPSGLDSDTGRLIHTEASVKATHTLTFIGAKPGLFTAYGRDVTGEISIAPLELNAALAPTQQGIGPIIWRNAPTLFVPQLPPRTHQSHKGTFGNLAVVGGAAGLCGAPILAARAALFAGTGKVYVALLSDQGLLYDPPYPELMLCKFDTLEIDSMDALAIGCGMGHSEQAMAVVNKGCNASCPMIIDADALNLIAQDTHLAALVVRHRNTILTPHPLEAARLLKCELQAVQGNRLAAARELAAKFASIIVLKGSGTVIASPDGRVVVNPTGHAALATGGTGDVLSGLIGALLAQRMQLFEAALAAVFLHGRAAESFSEDGIGPVGLTAGEIAPRFRQLFNQLTLTHLKKT